MDFANLKLNISHTFENYFRICDLAMLPMTLNVVVPDLLFRYYHNKGFYLECQNNLKVP